jgi:hypothetical protein
MELPVEVLIHNEILGVKGARAVLIQVNPAGFYEVNCFFGDRAHRTYMPIAGTVVICREPVDQTQSLEIER